MANQPILRPGAVALVTGASAGFGAACVVFALEQPPHVIIAQLVVVPTSQW